jgi:hypothetical protein
MKAAYVMLAGCESDLARTIAPAGPSTASTTIFEHHHRAAEHLRRVYGNNVHSGDLAPATEISSTPITPGEVTEIPGPHVPASNMFPDLPHLSPLKQDSTLRKAVIPPDQATRRELQSLRDRNNHLSTSLNSTRNELRSLQNQLRVAEENIRSLDRQASEAKRKETELKRRLHNEVGRRRLAEETIGRRERLIDQLDAKLENIAHQDRQQMQTASRHDKSHSESEDGLIQEGHHHGIPSLGLNLGYFTMSNMQAQ